MAFSVECRVPFIEPEVVEYLFSKPANFKMNNGWQKWPLRIGLDGILHKDIQWRRTKFGYTTPEEKWYLLNRDKIIDLILSHRRYNSQYLDLKTIEDSKGLNLTINSLQKLFRAVSASIFLEIFANR